MLTFVVETHDQRIIKLIDRDPKTWAFFDEPTRFLEPENCEHSIAGVALARLAIEILGETYDLSWGVCRCGVFVEEVFRDSLFSNRHFCFVLDTDSVRARVEKARSCPSPDNQRCGCPAHQSATEGW